MIHIVFGIISLWCLIWAFAYEIRKNIRESRRKKRNLEIANYAQKHDLSLYEARKILYPNDK